MVSISGLATLCVIAVAVGSVQGASGRIADVRPPWWAMPSANGAIEGYASQVSALPGDTVDLKVSVGGGERYRVRVYRLGDRTGRGDDELLACLPSCTGDERGKDQEPPQVDQQTGRIRAPWTTTDRLHLDPSWRSGYLVIQFVVTSGPAAGRAGWTQLIMREPPAGKHSAILVQIPTNTEQAYNRWGGKSSYSTEGGGTPATHVSFDRPYSDSLIGWEYPLIRYLESNGYDVSYQTDFDTHRDPTSLLRHRLIVVNGHDEYWTSTIRDAFETARDAGSNLLFFGANIGYWQVRYEDGGRTMVAYKSIAPDPVTDVLQRTSLFRELGNPECELLGIQHQGGTLRWGQADYRVNAEALTDPWFAGTGFVPGDRVAKVVGIETDTIPGWLQAKGETCIDRPLTTLLRADRGGDSLGDARFVRYTARSGARVASAGTLDLGAAIDDVVQRMRGEPSLVDRRMQRFLKNALEDMLLPAPVKFASARVRDGVVTFRIVPTGDRRTEIDVRRASGGLVCRACPSRFSVPGRVSQKYLASTVDLWGRSKQLLIRASLDRSSQIASGRP